MSGPHRAVTATVNASPETLWSLISDVTRMGEWSPENTGAEWVSGEPGTVGARFQGRNRRGRASWSTTCEVTEAERGRVFAFAVGRKRDSVWRYELSPLPDGRTRVQESYRLARPIGAVSRLVTRLTTGVRDREDDLEQGMRTTLERLAAVAQQQGTARLP